MGSNRSVLLISSGTLGIGLAVAETRMTEALQQYQRVDREAFARSHPGRSLLQPDDIVGQFLFLASDESRFVAGQVIAVDTGRRL
jgi:NAD(P)-dependent dehydrogenase (short-subunit alcohol dehydrogenase family)